ncbi:MAG: PP2C family serine/threonine-protein phosphatase [Gammaproteobacteria bacterium]
MIVETASNSLLGDREENQDRLTLLRRGDTLMVAVIDGMGGHEAGAEAAQTAIDTLHRHFASAELPCTDPAAFLEKLLQAAHHDVVELGSARDLGAKPRATCVLALIQSDRATWAHIGDSRVYLLRDQKVETRTRDHSHVEILLQEGLISEDEFRLHPLRNYVEHCLGGEPGDATVAVSETHKLEPNDLILLCSDGMWSGAEDSDIAFLLGAEEARTQLQDTLDRLLKHAVAMCEPQADNTTAAVVLWQGVSAS